MVLRAIRKERDFITGRRRWPLIVGQA